jgi:hypothetical protein
MLLGHFSTLYFKCKILKSMKKSFTFLLLAGSSLFLAQVGVNTPNPQASLHIDGAKNNPATGVPSALQQIDDFAVTSTGSIGIGTIAPDASAALDIKSTTKGFLPPRTTLVSSTDAVTIPSPATGLTVYHSGNAAMEAGLYSNVGTSSSPSWNKGQAVSTPNEGGRFYKMIYRGATNDPTKTLSAGLFEWRIVLSPNSDYESIQLRLKQIPATPITIQGPRLAWLPTGSGIVNTLNASLNWTTVDWATWKELDIQFSGASHLYYLDVSGTEDFYRVSFYTRTNSYTSLLVELY